MVFHFTYVVLGSFTFTFYKANNKHLPKSWRCTDLVSNGIFFSVGGGGGEQKFHIQGPPKLG